MADATLSSLASVVSLFLPAGLSQEADVRYELRNLQIMFSKTTVESRLIKLLKERGPLRGRQIDTHFRKVDWRKSAGYLVREGRACVTVHVAAGTGQAEIHQDCAAGCFT